MKVLEAVPLGEGRLSVEEDPATEGVRVTVAPGWGEAASTPVVSRKTLRAALETVARAVPASVDSTPEPELVRLGIGVVQVTRPQDLEVGLLVHVQGAGPDVGQLVRRMAPGGAFDVFIRPTDRHPSNMRARAAYLREGIERGFITPDVARQIEGL